MPLRRAGLTVLMLTTLVASGHADPASPYLEERPGRGPAGVSCKGAAPCVLVLDFAYVIMARGWKVHYLLDFASPEAPLRRGTATEAEVDERALAALRDLLVARKVERAAIACAVAMRLPGLVGLGEVVEVKLPRTRAKPLAAVTAREINQRWAAARAAASDGKESPAPVFSEAQLAKMTSTTFVTPTLFSMSSVVATQTCKGAACTESMVRDTTLYVLYSPESSIAYVADASMVVPMAVYERKERAARAGALAAISATLAATHHDQVAVPRSSMCGLGVLPNAGWFTWKP